MPLKQCTCALRGGFLPGCRYPLFVSTSLFAWLDTSEVRCLLASSFLRPLPSREAGGYGKACVFAACREKDEGFFRASASSYYIVSRASIAGIRGISLLEFSAVNPLPPPKGWEIWEPCSRQQVTLFSILSGPAKWYKFDYITGKGSCRLVSTPLAFQLAGK